MRSDITGGRGMSEQVRAEMVANVFQIAVAHGDSVDVGSVLLVLESMKMEIPVLSESPGVISEIKVREGDVVQEGDVLVIIE
jgi:acetyl-CoA carboxylase biotin carboxyl carrier protein